MNILDFSVYIVVAVVMAILVFVVIRITFNNRRLRAMAIQADLNLIKAMAQLEKIKNNTDVEKTDGFLKFISDSRDWAFQYIEDIQKALDEYDAALNTDDATIINEAYKKLIDFLPKDDVVK